MALGALGLLLFSCRPSEAPPTPVEAGLDVALPPGVRPPAPPTPRDLDPAAVALLPATEDGRPVLLSTGSPGPDGYEIELVYDRAIDDPISRWGQCLSRVVSCYRENAGGPIAACVAVVERCASDAGGEGCCPPACLDAFEGALRGGMVEDDAVDSVFVEGDCVEGLAAIRAAAEAVTP